MNRLCRGGIRFDASVKSLIVLRNIHFSRVVPLNDTEITDSQDQGGKPSSRSDSKAKDWCGAISGCYWKGRGGRRKEHDRKQSGGRRHPGAEQEKKRAQGRSRH